MDHKALLNEGTEWEGLMMRAAENSEKMYSANEALKRSATVETRRSVRKVVKMEITKGDLKRPSNCESSNKSTKFNSLLVHQFSMLIYALAFLMVPKN